MLPNVAKRRFCELVGDISRHFGSVVERLVDDSHLSHLKVLEARLRHENRSVDERVSRPRFRHQRAILLSGGGGTSAQTACDAHVELGQKLKQLPHILLGAPMHDVEVSSHDWRPVEHSRHPANNDVFNVSPRQLAQQGQETTAHD